MPGGAGRLVVLDRSGRVGRQFQLTDGAATIGKAPGCDVRVLQQIVAPHHATIVVHSNQSIIRNVGNGETLVNGKAISVAALQHNDVITVGDRCLRWQYEAPPSRSPLKLPEVPYKSARGARTPRRATVAALVDAQPHIRKTLEMQHRASMPGNAGGKQVAIVQPQRRDTSEHTEGTLRSPIRSRASRSDDPNSPADAPRSPRHSLKQTHNPTPNISVSTSKTKLSTPKASPSLLQTTKASLWIESRKSSPRKSVQSVVTPSRVVPKRAAASAKKSTPLRLTVLRKAQSAHKVNVTKIEAPLKIDAMKQAALMLMAGHSRRLPSLKQAGARAAPVLAVPRRSPGMRPQGSAKRKSKRGSRASKGKSVSVLEVTDTGTTLHSSVASDTDLSTCSRISPHVSPYLPSPKKSALRDPSAKNRSRKNESIKFDLSNLENYSQEDDVLMVSASSRTRKNVTSQSDISENLTLHYSDASTMKSPSPRRPIHLKGASKMLEKIVSPLKDSRVSEYKDATLTPGSPRAKKSLRSSIILQKALDTTENNASTYLRRTSKTLTDHSFDTTAESAFRTRTMSPRSARDIESYSIVDLVSIDSNESGKSASMYDSVGSTRSSSIVFGTPQGGSRKTRSTIDPNLLTSSTPYVGKTRTSVRSNSSPRVRRSSPNKTASTRRSKSLTTPENSEETQKHISINSTRISRVSRSRSRINDSDLQFLNSSIGDSESPKTSRRSTKADKSGLSSSSPKSSPRISTHTVSENSPRTSQASGRKSTLHTSFADSVSQLSPRRGTSQRSPIYNESQISTRRSQSQMSPRSSAQTSQTSISQVDSGSNTSQRSPSKSRSPKNASPQRSPAPSSKNRSSRSNLTLDISRTTEEGIVTPENSNSPPEVGTPVLSIQSLLDSSQSAFSFQQSPKKTRGSVNFKTKSIGVLRSGKKAQSSVKSKSFITTGRKSLRSVGENSELNESIEENVTPKSGVKLVQEAVKNKHSTAKKPQSKRSIIDNLNESDIVKQLFNSPVKRKLSQSMTEFSRNKLFDEDNEPRRRPARNTVALTGRTPDNSLLDNTDRYTPEHFVSPLSTPGNSPNLSRIKRLYAKNSPRNDLGNVKGVKNLLRTPRTRKSVKNDLRNVSGVKAVFAKSPKNRLSDVRVKEMFAASPKNDLRRVTGVKHLFQSEKKRKSPRNDLSDVRGVKNLFNRKSAENDLRNLSGVKKTLRNRSPRNDLRDVRGVKRMFYDQRSNESADLSGVEELFDVSTVSNTSTRDPEALFDQLIGKPPIKAVYSKSFIANRPQKKKIRRNSLRKSIELITNNVDQWIEQELQKCLHKNKANQSRKSNVTRELQKLAMDTVAGTEIRTSRIRNNSTLNKSTTEGKTRTAAAVYSAHTLPIKKRSFVEASLEKSANSSKGDRSNTLPIKKRAVVHSTPVKGRYDLTMNASELGRVSPIAALDRTHGASGEPDVTNRSKQPKSPNQKSKRATRANIIEEPEMELVEELPKSLKQARSTQAKSDKIEQFVTQTIRSPRGRNEGRSPLQTRANKSVIEIKPVQSPKGRNTKTSILNASNQKVALHKGLRTRSPKVVLTRMSKVISSKVSPKVTMSPKPKGRRTKASVSEVTTEKSPKPKRGRSKVRTTTADVEQPRSRRTRSNTEKQDSKESPTKARGKKNVENKVWVSPNKAQKRAGAAKTPEKAERNAQTKLPAKKTRGSKAKASPVKPARSTRNKTDVTEVTNTKKGRKSLVISKKPPIMSPKPAAKKVETSKRAPRRKADVKKIESPLKSPRAKTPKATRARLVVAKPSPTLNPRRAKANQNATDSDKSLKESSKKSALPKRTRRNTPTESPKTTLKAEPKKSAAKNAVKQTKPSPPAKRGRQRVEELEPSAKRGRTRNNTSPIKLASSKKQSKKQLTPKQPPPKPSPKKIRGKNVSQESIQAPKTNRRTNAKVEAAQEPQRGRKRKTTDDIPAVPAKVAKSESKTTRGRKTVADVNVKKTSPIKEVSPVKGKTRTASLVKEQAKTASSVKGKARTASSVKGKTIAASPVKQKASRHNKNDFAKPKREESLIKITRSKRQAANESEARARARAREAADSEAQGKLPTTSVAAKSSRSKKYPAAPAKVVKGTRCRRPRR